jgi:hypothetical protein
MMVRHILPAPPLLSPYEQDRFLALASESLYKSSNDEKQQLRETIVQMRETGSIKPSTIR